MQFFLSICDGTRRIADPEPYEFPSLGAARYAALAVARDVVESEDLDPSALASRRVEIADAAGRTLASLGLEEWLAA